MQPNILYIFTDQQSSTMMGCAGNPDVQTPALDSLAARGVRFDQAYCTYPLCTPSRASMFTGRYPHEVGVNRNNVGIDECCRENELGHVLSRTGYECVYGGKWHVPEIAVPDDVHGFRRISGFDDTQLADACIEFFRQPHAQPFFCVVSFDNPHNICEWAREQPLPWGGVSSPPAVADCPALPENHAAAADEPNVITRHRHDYSLHRGLIMQNTADDWRQLRWAYARLTEMVDHEIGRILAGLDDAGLADDTLVIFSSDHGDQDAAHGLSHKNVPYEESIRVPLIIAGAGVTQQGTRSHLVDNGPDLFATICNYAGAELPEGCHGLSLRPILTGLKLHGFHDYIVSEMLFDSLQDKPKARVVRSYQHKYIAFDRGRHREQLFDLLDDPGETQNLAGDRAFAAVLQEHREFLREWCERTNDDFGGRHYGHPDTPYMVPGDEYV